MLYICEILNELFYSAFMDENVTNLPEPKVMSIVEDSNSNKEILIHDFFLLKQLMVNMTHNANGFALKKLNELAKRY